MSRARLLPLLSLVFWAPLRAEEAAEPRLAALPVSVIDTPPARPTSQIEQVRELAAKAMVEEKLGNYPAALRFYTMALSASPGHPFLRNSLDRLSRAILNRAERKMSDTRTRYVEEALRRSEVTGFQKDEVEALALEGHRLLSQGVALPAVDMFYRALEKKARHESTLEGMDRAKRKISARIRKGRFDTPQQYAAYQGMDRFMDGDWLGAIDALERAIRMGPLQGELATARLPDYAAQARKNLDRELWKTERKIVLEKAREHHDAGEWLEAEPLFKRILEADPGDEEARKLAETVFLKAEELRAREKEEERLKALKEALAQARRAAETGDALTVLEASASALELDPENAEALSYLKASQERLRKQGFMAPEVAVQDAAEEAYRRALRHYGNDEPAEALKAVEEALTANPDHAEAKTLKDRLTAPKTGEESRP